MVVRSPKAARNPGGSSRVVPIFPELLPHKREAFEQAERGAVHVVARHRGDNLRTMAEKCRSLAGMTPWPKLYQNMRSSCQTDLADHLPIKLVCQWIGNTEAVTMKHYLQVTEAHFSQATEVAGFGTWLAVAAGGGWKAGSLSLGRPEHAGLLGAAPGAALSPAHYPNTKSKNPRNPRVLAIGSTPKGSRTPYQICTEPGKSADVDEMVDEMTAAP